MGFDLSAIEYICSLQSDLIRILNIFVLSNLAEYEYQKIEYSYLNILYSVPIIRIFEYIRVTLGFGRKTL